MRRASADEDGLCRIVFEVPCESTRLVFPKGAPPSTMDALLVFIHFIQASIPFFRCSGVEFCLIFSNSGPEAIYSAMNFFIGSHLAKLQFRSGDFVSRGVNAPKSCSRITALTPA